MKHTASSTARHRTQVLLMDGKAHTVEEVAQLLDMPETSASATIRNLRKEKFGGHRIHGAYSNTTGIYQYRMLFSNSAQHGA